MPRGLRYDVKPKAVGLVGDAVQPSNQVRLHKAINRKLTDAAAKAGGCGVLDVVCVELTHMNGVNLATALHRLARDFANNEAGLPGGAQALSEVTSHAAFPALLEAVRQRAMEVVAEREAGKQSDGDSGMPAQCASIVAWSLAWLNLKERALLQTLAELATPHLDGFKPYEVTNMLWAYAKLNEWNAPLFRAVAERLRARAKWEFKVQCLSVASWSFTTVKWRDEELFRSLAEDGCPARRLCSSRRRISNTLWAYGKQKIAHEELFKALGWSAFELVWQCRFKPQDAGDFA
ncbi:unnamed protein product [Effrenium voratum]|nr:unnamed protein product [Effrenium voratum]